MIRPVRLPCIDTTGWLGENGGGLPHRFGSFETTMPLRLALKTLLALAIALPILYSTLAGVRYLLVSMGDAAGAAMIDGVGGVCLTLWAVSIIGLVIVTAATLVLGRLPGDDTGDR
jgi:hypothetical protein